MAKLTEYTRYSDAQKFADSQALWDLFDGNRDYLNIAHECVSRHADGSGRAAVRIAHADGADEVLSFDEIAAGSSRFAHWLVENGIEPGNRIVFLLEPSLMLPPRSSGGFQFPVSLLLRLHLPSIWRILRKP